MRGPGPAPTYRPQFPAGFVEHARNIVAQRSVAHDLHQRAALALLLHEKPFVSSVAAARQVQLHPGSIVRWRRRWAQGDFSLADREGRGRKPHFSPSGPRRRQSAGV